MGIHGTSGPYVLVLQDPPVHCRGLQGNAVGLLDTVGLQVTVLDLHGTANASITSASGLMLLNKHLGPLYKSKCFKDAVYCR